MAAAHGSASPARAAGLAAGQLRGTVVARRSARQPLERQPGRQRSADVGLRQRAVTRQGVASFAGHRRTAVLAGRTTGTAFQRTRRTVGGPARRARGRMGRVGSSRTIPPFRGLPRPRLRRVSDTGAGDVTAAASATAAAAVIAGQGAGDVTAAAASARHRSTDPYSEAEEPPSGGQSVAELLARLHTAPSEGGRRRRRED